MRDVLHANAECCAKFRNELLTVKDREQLRAHVIFIGPAASHQEVQIQRCHHTCLVITV